MLSHIQVNLQATIRSHDQELSWN